MLNNYKILIVDDEKSLVEMYGLKFEKEGFNVRTTYEWLEALSLITEFLPDVILLDIMMPWMNWFETLSTIRDLAPSLVNTKIIMFSNLSSRENVEKAMHSWADEYLIKANTTPRKAVEIVKNILWIKEKNSINNEKVFCPHCHKNITDICKK